MPVAALPSRTALLGLLSVLAGLLVVAGSPSPAWGHTEFDSSDPADGQSVAGPLDRVTVSFTNPASPSGEGIVVLDGSGATIAPASVESADGTSFVLTFDPPLGPGEYGVRWQVQAGDAHPIDGAFRFVVAGPSPATAAPSRGAGAAPSRDATADEGRSSLDEALEQDSADASVWALGVARVMTIGGTLVGLGALVALRWVVRGRREELRSVRAWIRLAGVAVAAGAVVELVVLAGGQPGGIGDLWGTSPGVAVLLRLVGGTVVAAGFGSRSGGTVVAWGGGPEADEADRRWVPSWGSAVGVAGFALVLASFWFDGHTVSRGPWALHAALNLVHLIAGAVWVGGVFVMTVLVWRRHRRGQPGDGAWLVIRFSPVAAVSLAAVALAGVSMAVIVLQTPQDLWITPWGRVLLAKSIAVGVAALLGAGNHLRLRPALERDPTSPALAARVRTTLSVELGAFAAVVVLTAWLVAAAA